MEGMGLGCCEVEEPGRGGDGDGRFNFAHLLIQEGAAELGGESVLDTHCHLDLLFSQEGWSGSWEAFKSSRRFGPCFGGAIADFCHPASWAKGLPILRPGLMSVTSR